MRFEKLLTNPVRYAVVGLGHISQTAVLPGFANAENSQLVALISGDAEKRELLSAAYGVSAYDYCDLEVCIARERVDAVYIGTPDHQHREFAVRSARARAHVLCEKPLASSYAEGEKIVSACDQAGVLLMVAYRLHFNTAHLELVRLVWDGAIGRVRSVHCLNLQTVEEGNSRLRTRYSNGPLYDVGIYCVNAARYLLRREPVEAYCMDVQPAIDPRFREVPEQVAGILFFAPDLVATFTCAFGSASLSEVRVVGSEGWLRLSPAFPYDLSSTLEVVRGEQRTVDTFPMTDQFGAQLAYFSSCILSNEQPEPDGTEGLADLAVLEALQASAKTGARRSIRANVPVKQVWPSFAQAISLPPIHSTTSVNVRSPSGG